jgi:hypothetical protein
LPKDSELLVEVSFGFFFIEVFVFPVIVFIECHHIYRPRRIWKAWKVIKTYLPDFGKMEELKTKAE